MENITKKELVTVEGGSGALLGAALAGLLLAAKALLYPTRLP